MKTDTLKFKAYDTWNEEWFFSEKSPSLAKFFESVQLRKEGGNNVLIFEGTGFVYLNDNDLYENDKILEPFKGTVKWSDSGEWMIEYTGCLKPDDLLADKVYLITKVDHINQL